MADDAVEETEGVTDDAVAQEETVQEETVQEETATEAVAQEEVVADVDADSAESSDSLTDGLTLGEGAPADLDDAQPVIAPQIRGKIDKFGVAMGTGRRKTSVARVRIKNGTGQITVNGRPDNAYFQLERDQQAIRGPLNATGVLDDVDVWIRVNGGGTTGQAGASILGIARALQARDVSLHTRLSSGGYLTRDSRMVERKKYGLRKARRSFQFSKR